MIQPHHYKPVVWFFDGYIPFLLRRNFSGIHIHANEKKFPHAVMLLCNHSSWWDGFFGVYLNNKVFKKRYHVMMLEDQLQSRKIFSLSGAYSIQQKSKSILESLQFTADLLDDPRNLVQLFPQGKIESSHVNEFTFQRGMMHILQQVKNEIHLVFMVSLTDYFSAKKPELHLFTRSCDALKKTSLAEIEFAFNDFYAQCKIFMRNIPTQ